MGKVRVSLPDGRIVDGEITAQRKTLNGEPVLIADGKPYSGLDAVNQGLFVYPVNDPVIDQWLNTFRAGG